jgi:hypothetical protein
MITPDEAATGEVESEAEDAPEEAPPTINVSLVRELAAVTDMLKAREGEVEDLKRRKAQLSQQLLPAFEMNGVKNMQVDGRKAYVHTTTFPQYLEKPTEEGGGKYTARDVVDALRAIGRDAQIQPETVNHNTLGAILREYRDQDLPLPEALAKLVKLGERPEVRVGGARK